MKVQVTSNFSFSKLAQALPGILEKHSAGVGVGAAKTIKDAIKKGKYEPLRKSTIDIRKRGRSPSAGFMKTNSKKPLIHTGALLRSIRHEKDGIKIHKYGKLQNDGFITHPGSMIPGKKVDKNKQGRPFIDRGMAMAADSPEGKQAAKDLNANIRKALRK